MGGGIGSTYLPPPYPLQIHAMCFVEYGCFCVYVSVRERERREQEGGGNDGTEMNI